jgi:hypothetical protein
MVTTKIPWRGKMVNVNPTRPPADERQLIGFLRWNDAPACFVKTGNAWYKLARQGSLVYVCRVLYLLSLKEWLDIAKNESFIE